MEMFSEKGNLLNKDNIELESLRWERKTLEGITCNTSEETKMKVYRLTVIDTQIAYLIKMIEEREKKAYV